MPGDHVDLIAFDLAGEYDRRLALHDPLPQLSRHPLGVVRVQVQFPGDLLVREVQPHEVEAEHPDPQRLMVPGEDGAGQIIEPSMAAGALRALPVRLGLVTAPLDDLAGVTIRASDAVRPAEGTHRVVALGVVDEGLDVQHEEGHHLRQG